MGLTVNSETLGAEAIEANTTANQGERVEEAKVTATEGFVIRQGLLEQLKRTSHPMAKPQVIDAPIKDIEILAVDSSQRPHINISGKAAATASITSKASAPITRPQA